MQKILGEVVKNMARIPEAEIERLKEAVPVARLGEANTTQSGTNAPQATLIANLLTAGIDQTQLRQRLTASCTSISAATSEHFLTDANNNTLALADSTQTLSTRYSDDVYGQTTQTTLSGTRVTRAH
jgi:hypothetical protein